MTGTSLSHFRILAKIGEGGMGVVYSAEDEKLRRPVALKVLPPDLVCNEERRLRFLREARAAAAVTHPNIATIYEVGEADGVVFIAMELVEGKTLRALMGDRPLPMRDALRVAVEVAEGLGRAHEAGVVHRDLKPDNVIVGADGHAKILDFGLAKVLEDPSEAGTPELSRLKTISGEMTQAGKILGTASYMSPEQARGEVVDARSDIFSFGTMLYEMATGRMPFQGRTNTDLLSAIIRDEPAPVTALNPNVPAELQRIIGECLEKDPAERYQHTDQLAVDLRKLRRSTSSDVQAVRSVSGPSTTAIRATTTPRGRRIRWLLVGIVVALITAAGAAGYRRWHRPASSLVIGDRVIVADFVNGTGHADYDTAVRDAFEQMLSRSAFVDVVRGGALQDLVKAKAGTAVARIDADLARTLCGDAACGGFFAGAIASDGKGITLQASLNLVGEVRPAITRSVQAASDQEVLGAIHELVLNIRRDLGESPRAVGATPLPATRSLPAYAAYALGMAAEPRVDEQQPLLKRAIEIDPSFVDAYQDLAIVQFNLGDTRGYRNLIEEAYRRSSALPEQLRLRSEILYLDARYEYDRETESLNSYISLYPFDYVGHHWLAWIYQVPYEDPSSAEKFLRAAFELQPSALEFEQLCATLAAQGKRAEIDRLLQGFRSRRSDADAVGLCRLLAAAGADDLPGTLEAIRGIEQTSAAFTKEFAASWKVAVLERWGRLEQARAAIGAAEEQALLLGALGDQQLNAMDAAWLEMRRTGRPAALSPRVGELASQSLLRLRDLAIYSLESGLAAPLEQVIQSHAADQKGSKSRFVAEELAFGRACLDFVRGQAGSARAVLEPITRGTRISARHYALGRIYESLGLWREAAGQYEEVLRASRVFYMQPSIRALGQFRLARAYGRLGDTARARQWYARFTTDWKDADPDIPELIEARQRLQALGGAAPQPTQPAGSVTQPMGAAPR